VKLTKENYKRKISIWQKWQRVRQMEAIRIKGPFSVATESGEVHCEDGYLAFQRGNPWPYAITRIQFEKLCRAQNPEVPVIEKPFR